jgi:hypothetical protein
MRTRSHRQQAQKPDRSTHARTHARTHAQAFGTLGGSDTAAIQGDTLKNFVKLFDLDIDALLGEHDDGDGALELHEFKQLLTDKPSVDMLPHPSFQPAAIVPVYLSHAQNPTHKHTIMVC